MSLAKRVKELEVKLQESEERLKKSRELANQKKSARKTPKPTPVVQEQRYCNTIIHKSLASRA